MFSAFGQIPLAVPKFGFGRTSSTGPVNIQPVTVHDVETIPDKKARRLKHLLKLNHATFSILYNKLRFHNHTPHVGAISSSPFCSHLSNNDSSEPFHSILGQHISSTAPSTTSTRSTKMPPIMKVTITGKIPPPKSLSTTIGTS